jgi:ABC-type transporter MlaC component
MVIKAQVMSNYPTNLTDKQWQVINKNFKKTYLHKNYAGETVTGCFSSDGG